MSAPIPSPSPSHLPIIGQPAPASEPPYTGALIPNHSAFPTMHPLALTGVDAFPMLIVGVLALVVGVGLVVSIVLTKRRLAREDV